MDGYWAEGLHRTRDGHVTAQDSVVPALRGGDEHETLWVGLKAVVQGPIRHAGAVVLGRGARIWGGIEGGHEVVIGADSQVKGPVKALGRVVVQHGAMVQGAIETAGDVLLLGDCIVQDVQAGGDVRIVGAPRTGRLLPAGRVQTRPW